MVAGLHPSTWGRCEGVLGLSRVRIWAAAAPAGAARSELYYRRWPAWSRCATTSDEAYISTVLAVIAALQHRPTASLTSPGLRRPYATCPKDEWVLEDATDLWENNDLTRRRPTSHLAHRLAAISHLTPPSVLHADKGHE